MEALTILRRLLFSRVGCINRQGKECMFLMVNSTRGGRKCCYKQCQKVQEHLTGINRGRIYTGYFAQLKKYQELGLTPISIARYSPHWFTGYCLKDLAPSDSLLKGYKDGRVSVEEYENSIFNSLRPSGGRRYYTALRRLLQTEWCCVVMRNLMISVIVISCQNI